MLYTAQEFSEKIKKCPFGENDLRCAEETAAIYR